jgi:hypothetical protein
MVSTPTRKKDAVANFLIETTDGDVIEAAAIGRSWRADFLNYVPADPDAVSNQGIKKEDVAAIELSNDQTTGGRAANRHRLSREADGDSNE